MAVLEGFQNFLAGTITDAPLLVGATTINSSAFADLMALPTGDIQYVLIVLDPDGVNGDPEIVRLDGHTASATSVSVESRGFESTTAREHPAGTAWRLALTANQITSILTDIDTLDTDLAAAEADILTAEGRLDALEALEPTTAFIEIGDYTPGLTNITLGTGGSPTNEAQYTWIGGPDVGDVGILRISGYIELGTTGEAIGTGPQLTLPSGFEFRLRSPDARNRLGNVSYSAGGTNALGFTQYAGADTIGVTVGNVASTFLSGSVVGAGVPGTWTNGDLFYWNAEFEAVRV